MRRAPTAAHGRLLPAALLAALCLAAPACQQKMALQPSSRPHRASAFFANGLVDQHPVDGTVARGYLRVDSHLFTGMREPRTGDWALPAGVAAVAGVNPLGAAGVASAAEDRYVTTFPYPVTAKVLRHGMNRYMIFCAVCHDALGTGHGNIPDRGYTPPPSYHNERLRNVPVGHIFDVVTRGYGSMPSYSAQIPPRDRWAIVAYVRALQLSQHFPEGELTDAMRGEWSADKAAATEGSR